MLSWPRWVLTCCDIIWCIHVDNNTSQLICSFGAADFSIDDDGKLIWNSAIAVSSTHTCFVKSRDLINEVMRLTSFSSVSMLESAFPIRLDKDTFTHNKVTKDTEINKLTSG